MAVVLPQACAIRDAAIRTANKSGSRKPQPPELDRDHRILTPMTHARLFTSRMIAFAAAVAAVVPVSIALLPAAGAATDVSLTFFNGTWTGSGIDRNSASQALQRTSCTAQSSASRTTLQTRTVCKGDKGLTKDTSISVTLNGRSFSGRLTQNSNAFPYRFSGSLSGTRGADSAVFSVHSVLLGKVATVSLQMTGDDSYRLHVTDDGQVLMSAQFNRR
jgi:hypothetical protein